MSPMTTRRLALLALTLAVTSALAFWQIQKSRTFQFFAPIVSRVETGEKLVALTFDDGPRGDELLLPALAEHGAKATFFVCGAGMETDMATARRLVAAGHELANHSFSHRRMLFVTPGFVREELDRTDALIREAGHQGPILFRPPYGKKFLVLPWVLARSGRTTIMWDVDPEYEAQAGTSGRKLAAYVKAHVRPGSIVLLHGHNWVSRVTLPLILAELKAEGYRFVTVSSLLARRAHHQDRAGEVPHQAVGDAAEK